MKKHFTITQIILFLFLCFSCSSAPKENKKEILFDNATECKDFISLFKKKEIKLTPILWETENIPTNTMKFIVYNNEYYICDIHYQHTILRYDKNGKFICRIGNRGEGANEYTSFTSFSINQDTISIAATKANGERIILYDLNGNYLDEKEIQEKIVSFARNKKGEWLINSGRNIHSASHQLTLYSPDFTEKKVFWELSEQENNIPVFEYNFATNNRHIYYHEAFNNQLYIIQDGEVHPSYKLIFRNKNNFDKVRTGDFMQETERLFKEGFYLVSNYFESKNHVYVYLGHMGFNNSEEFYFLQHNKNDGTTRFYKIEKNDANITETFIENNTIYFLVSDLFIQEVMHMEADSVSDIYILTIRLDE